MKKKTLFYLERKYGEYGQGISASVSVVKLSLISIAEYLSSNVVYMENIDEVKREQ